MRIPIVLRSAASAAVVVLLACSGKRADIAGTTPQRGGCALLVATRKVLASVHTPLLIRGFVSAKTHPAIVRLIAEVQALLAAYRAAAGPEVRVELVDPTTPDARRQAKELFDLDPTPLRIATADRQEVVEAYFAIAVQYGDQHVVVGLDDLLDVRSRDPAGLEIRLNNIEYLLTKAIEQTIARASGFEPAVTSVPGKLALTAYITSDTLPDNWKDAPADLAAAVAALQKRGAKLEVATVSPAGAPQTQELYERYGIRPMQDLLSHQTYYFALVLEVGDRTIRIVPPQHLSVSALEATLADGILRVRGVFPIVGVWQPPAPPASSGAPPQAAQTFTKLRHSLEGTYEVDDVSLVTAVPREIAVLVLAGPANLTSREAENVDRFVMRGGALVVLDGRYRLAPDTAIAVEKVTTGIEGELAAWGISVADELVLDTQNQAVPVPDPAAGNALAARSYPYFVNLSGTQLSSESLVTRALSNVVMQWSSPVEARDTVGDVTHQVTTLLTSSGDSWLGSGANVDPAGPPAQPTGARRARVLAVAVRGQLASALAERNGVRSPADTRIVVFGSSAFASDDILDLEQQLASIVATSNVELVDRAVEWALADADLLSIPSHCGAER